MSIKLEGWTRPLIVLLGLVLAQAAFGQATDRAEFPERPEPTDQSTPRDDAPWEKLTEALSDRESVGFAFYWGEWLSTEIEERSQEVLEGRRQATARAGAGFNPSRSDYWEVAAASEGQFRIVEREEVISRADVSELAGEQLWRVESAFVSALAPRGVRLIDPGLAVRRQSSRQPDQPDRRRLETGALLVDASHVLEVLGRRDAASESGWEFRVRVTDLKAGHRLVDFTTYAVPLLESERRYVATEGGFELDEPVQAGPEDFGRELARQLADRLLEVI